MARRCFKEGVYQGEARDAVTIGFSPQRERGRYVTGDGDAAETLKGHSVFKEEQEIR